MPKSAIASSPASNVPDWRTVLGLVEPKDADWGRVRAEQINRIQRLAPVRLATNLVAIVSMVAVLIKKVPPISLATWAGCLTLLAMLSAFHSQQGRPDTQRCSPP